MTTELNPRAISDIGEALAGAEYLGLPKSEELRTKLLPDAIEYLISDPRNDFLIQKLLDAKDSITLADIGVAFAEGDVKVDQFGLFPQKQDGSMTLLILVSPDVVERTGIRNDSLSKFKEVLLQAVDEQRFLVMDQKFVPYSQTLEKIE